VSSNVREVYVKGDIDEGPGWWRFVPESQSDFSLVLKTDYDKAIESLRTIMQEYQEDSYDSDYDLMSNPAYLLSMKALTELGEL